MLLLSLIFQAANADQKLTVAFAPCLKSYVFVGESVLLQGVSPQCADYLRCRSDEFEQRWKCSETQRKVVSEVCRIERHLRSVRWCTL